MSDFKTLKEKEFYLENWFLKNELYSDGSNIYCWIPQLKNMLEDVFGINITEGEKPKEACIHTFNEETNLCKYCGEKYPKTPDSDEDSMTNEEINAREHGEH